MSTEPQAPPHSIPEQTVLAPKSNMATVPENPVSNPVSNSIPTPLSVSVQPDSTSYHPSSSSVVRSTTAPRQSYDGRVPSGKVRRLTKSNEDSAQQRRRDFSSIDSASSIGAGADDDVLQFRGRRRPSSRSSWVKRMSFISSRSNSPLASDRAYSPALAQSIDAQSFSQTSSSAPILGGRPSTSAGPNKLVKRFSSHQQLQIDPLESSSKSLGFLPRPATSHQRSAVLHQQQQLQHHHLHQESFHDSWYENQNLEVQTESEQSTWKHFFNLRINKIRSTKQKRQASYEDYSIHHSVPPSSNGDNDSFDGNTSVQVISRPESSSGPTHTPSVAVESPNDTNFTDEQKSQSDAPGVQRRFSISNLIRRQSSSGQTPKPSKLIKRNSRRIVSEPTQNIGLHVDNQEQTIKQKLSNKQYNVQHITQPQHTHTHTYLTTPGETVVISRNNSGNSSPFLDSNANSSTNHNSSHFDFNYNRPLLSQSNPHSPPSHSNPHSPPSLPYHHHLRRSNASAAISDQLSTLLGSDNEINRNVSSIDDEDTDHSTYFDSLRTRGTQSISGNNQKRRIDTIFDESPSPPDKLSPKLKELLPEAMLNTGTPNLLSINDLNPFSTAEKESINFTPVKTVRSDRADGGSPIARRSSKPQTPLPVQLSSPPNMIKALSLGTLEYDDNIVEEDDESRWSLDAESMEFDEEDFALKVEKNHSTIEPATNTPKIAAASEGEKGFRRDTLSGLFNWSEQIADNPLGSRSPPRPRTVHGKKDTTRGSRSTGRRAPSGLHARSQSVPVAPGQNNKREAVVTNKFGTWGVGSKGVSDEVWDDDFDFGEGQTAHKAQGKDEEEKRDSSLSMKIPQTIREQQVKVVNNIELVRKFGLLIEELKASRIKAAELNLLDTPNSSLWKEVDAMIELADQEVSDPFIVQQNTPPSPNQDMDEFDEIPEVSRAYPKSTPDSRRRSKSQRRSVLPSESDIFSTPKSTTSHPLNASPSIAAPNVAAPIPNRPRKDSEAMARSVIEALHRRKDVDDNTLPLEPVPPQKKVPFDTNTLRYIVTHVQKLVKRVENCLKPTAQRYNSDSTLTQIFKEPARINEDYEPDDINKRMKTMDLT